MTQAAPKAGGASLRRIKAPPPTLDSQLRAFLRSPESRRYAESLGMTALAPVVGWLVQPIDPLFLKNRFSWLIVPPVLIALRHGFGPGTTSALLLVAAVVFRNQSRPDGSGLPTELLFGMVGLAMIVGEIAASMTRRLAAMEAENAHLRTQFEGFSRSYALLELSHERMEQRSEATITPLRGALTSLAACTKDTGDAAPTLAALAPNTLLIMQAYGNVLSAAIYAVGSGGKIEGDPLATLGKPAPVLATDRLVAAALDTAAVTYAAPGINADETPLLVAVPIIDAKGTRLGVVAIHAIPLFSLESLNLRLLHVVAGYVGDLVSPSRWEDSGAKDDWARLQRHLDRACVEASAGRLPGVAMAFWCKKGDRGTSVLEGLLAKDLRVTDFAILQRDSDGNPMIFAVMPLTDEQGSLAFLARLEGLCRQRLGAGVAALGIQSRTWILGAESNPKALVAEFKDCLAPGAGQKLASRTPSASMTS